MDTNEAIIYVKVSRKDIDFLNKLIEGYEGLAMVTTTNAKEGIVKISTSASLKTSLFEVLKIIPRSIKIITTE